MASLRAALGLRPVVYRALRCNPIDAPPESLIRAEANELSCPCSRPSSPWS